MYARMYVGRQLKASAEESPIIISRFANRPGVNGDHRDAEEEQKRKQETKAESEQKEGRKCRGQAPSK